MLDFGLAKAFDPTPEGDPSQSPTLTAAATQMGVIMGTAAYMSPEQAAGKPTDKRSDIWSFGVVLFEMLTGQRLFIGETVSHVLASVLKTDPKWESLPTDTPEAVRRLSRRCLDKTRARRLPDIAVAILEIDEAQTAPDPQLVAPEASRPPTRQPVLPWVDNTIVVGSAEGLWSMPVAGGERTQLTRRLEGQNGHMAPTVLPNGQDTLFYIWTGDRETSQVAGYDFATSEWRTLLQGTSPQFAASGHLVFTRGDSLWAVSFDPNETEVVGEALPIVEGVSVNSRGWADAQRV